MDPVMEVALWQHRQQVRGRIEARCTDVLNETKPKQKKKEKKQMHVEKPTAPISLLSDSSESSDDSEATWDYDHSDNEMLADKMARWAAEKVTQQQPCYAPCQCKTPAKYPAVPMTIKKLWQEIEALTPAALEAPSCSCKTCPFAAASSHVPIMLQRRNLAKRLILLERALFGV